MDLREEKMMWQMAMMAAIFAGKSIDTATRIADQARDAYKARYEQIEG